MSREHVWSDWINELAPGRKRFTKRGEKGELLSEWSSLKLDVKARVVCTPCNNGWMSDIDGGAKEALSDLIAGKVDIVIDQSRANSIALFCFKTAAVLDLIGLNHKPFFSAAERYAFRESRAIPTNVKMWMAGFSPVGKGNIHSASFAGSTSPVNQFRTYVCTYAAGHFIFQLVAARTGRIFFPQQGFEPLAVPLWPSFRSFVWPPDLAIGSVQGFDSFSMRWKTVRIED